jgi:hypothetical protein
MVTIIKKGTAKKEMEKALSGLKSAKTFDAYKHCGKITLKEDPVAIQKKMRDEPE